MIAGFFYRCLAIPQRRRSGTEATLSFTILEIVGMILKRIEFVSAETFTQIAAHLMHNLQLSHKLTDSLALLLAMI